MKIIENLLTTPYNNPQELYRAFNEIPNLYEFFDASSEPLLSEALQMNDHALIIKNYEKLVALANHYQKLEATHKKFKKHYQICLALIIAHSADLLKSQEACHTLAAYYTKHPKKNKTSSTGKSYAQLVTLKEQSLRQISKSTVMTPTHIKPSGGTGPNQTHKVLTPPQESRRITEVTERLEVNSRVAGIEVFCGTLMELFIGPSQPTIYQKRGGLEEKASILSERIELKPCSEKSAVTTWATEDFKGAAEIDVASLFLADDANDLNNIGIKSDGVAVRTNFSRMIAPITLPLANQVTVKTQKIQGKDHIITDLKATDGFKLSAEDINKLPLIATKMPRPEIAESHFVPTSWWVNDLLQYPGLYAKAVTVARGTNYQEAKFKALLEKLLLPMELIQKLINQCIFHDEDKQKIAEWILTRKAKLTFIANDIIGFEQHIQNNGERIIDEIRTRYEAFVAKKPDLELLDAGQFNTLLLANMTTVQLAFARQRRAPVPDQKHPVAIKSIFNALHLKHDILTQKIYFIDSLSKLSLNDLSHLANYMQAVQEGKISNHPFQQVRAERYLFTSTWSEMYHAVKFQILDKLKKSYSPGKKITLEPYSYDHYRRQLSVHTGPKLTRFGKTATCGLFDKFIDKAKVNEEPTSLHKNRP